MEYLYLVLIGLVAGVSSGLLGVGGSIVIIPCLAILFPDQPYHQHAAAAMIVNSFASLLATWRHHRAGYVQISVIVRMLPAAVVGICFGVWLSNLQLFTSGHPEYLSKILAAFLIYVVAMNIRRLFRSFKPAHTAPREPAPREPSWLALLPGLMMGVPAGLLGVGGGFIAVPAQQVVLRTKLRNAIANSSSLIIFSAAVGAVYKNATLGNVPGATVSQSLSIAALLIPGAIVGSYLGALLMHISPIRVIRTVFICYLLWAGYSQWTADSRAQNRETPADTAAMVNAPSVAPFLSQGIPALDSKTADPLYIGGEKQFLRQAARYIGAQYQPPAIPKPKL